MGGALRTFVWIFGLYFIEGLPNAIVGTLSVGYYKSMGLDNTKTAMLTSLLYIPWVIKGIWGPLIDSVSTKRRWILLCSGVFALCFIALAAAQFLPYWIAASAAVFWALGFASATYDIAADGFYMLALNEREQSFFVGIRNAFYRVAVLFGQGAMLIIAGWGAYVFASKSAGWSLAFGVCVAVVLACLLFFKLFLPAPKSDIPRPDSRIADVLRGIKGAFLEFFRKKHIFSILAFVLFYRFAEAQLLKIVQPFMLDPKEVGGLGMSLSQLGWIYGTLAPVLLLLGGILGGLYISRVGLRRSMLVMALMMNLPNIIYVFMAAFQPDCAYLISALVGFEQFGYGFGFAAYMVYLMFASRGNNMTSSYAICTSFMALGIIFPGFFSGAMQSVMGYLGFFSWIMLSTLISFGVTWLAYRTLSNRTGAEP